MKKYTFSILIEKDEDGGFIGRVPELMGCHSQGDTIVELMSNVREAIELCLEVYEKDGIDVFDKNYFQTQTIELAVS